MASSLQPGKTVPLAPLALSIAAAVSPIETFTVQEEPVPSWTESPLPEDYWTRPISGAARTWYVLAGNKLGGAANVWPIGSSGGNVGNYGYGQAPRKRSHTMDKTIFNWRPHG